MRRSWVSALGPGALPVRGMTAAGQRSKKRALSSSARASSGGYLLLHLLAWAAVHLTAVLCGATSPGPLRLPLQRAKRVVPPQRRLAQLALPRMTRVTRRHRAATPTGQAQTYCNCGSGTEVLVRHTAVVRLIPRSRTCRYIAWVEATFPSGGGSDGRLLPLLERATRDLHSRREYRNSVDHVALWVQYVSSPAP